MSELDAHNAKNKFLEHEFVVWLLRKPKFVRHYTRFMDMDFMHGFHACRKCVG
jgi:hypothetical protein